MGDASDIQGKYVQSIEVGNGGITVKYGNEINAKLMSGTVGLTPGNSVNGDVIWKCGLADNPSGWSGATTTASAASTSVAGKYLPSSCR
jgi:Tfp pilus assembly major pilin PilA